MKLSDFHASAGDWREQIRKNEVRSKLVIATFILIYLVIGLLVDIYVVQSMYPQASISQCFYALITFKITPLATLLLAAFAVISILISYAFYDRIMLLGTEYYEITPETARNLQEKQLYNVVEEMKVAAGLSFMPKVYIIEANYMNAFASGFSERSAMVAITRGLMEKLDRAEMQAVMAHELSHIRHHDIKLTLMVAILSNILLVVVDILFYSVIFKRNSREENRLATIIIILRYLLPLITLILALYLSRSREYMADSGCVELMRDNEPMARALLKINQDHMDNAQQYEQEYGQTPHEQIRHAAYLFDPADIDPVKSLTNAFATHPSIKDRLRAIGFLKK